MDYSNFDMGSFQGLPAPPPTSQMYGQGAPPMTLPPQSFGQGFAPNTMGLFQPDAATVTGLNQTMANAIKAANAPKSPWAQGQDISNNIMGNVIMPFAGAFGAAGADDIAKGFLDKIDADKKTRQDMLKSNISQIKDITSAFDGLNRTQVAELGRKTAETNAQRMLQATANQKAVAEARLAETEKQRLMMEAHYKREDAAKDAANGIKDDGEKRKQKKDDALTPKLAAKYDAQTGKLIAQTGTVAADSAAKNKYMTENMADKKERTKSYAKMAGAIAAGAPIKADAAATQAQAAALKAKTGAEAEAYKQAHPTGKGSRASAMMMAGIPGAAPQVAQTAPAPQGPPQAAPSAGHPLVQKFGSGISGALKMYLADPTPANRALFKQAFGHLPD